MAPPAGTRASARLWFWTGAFVRSRFVIKGRCAERFWTVIVFKMPGAGARRKPNFLWRPCELTPAGERSATATRVHVMAQQFFQAEGAGDEIRNRSQWM